MQQINSFSQTKKVFLYSFYFLWLFLASAQVTLAYVPVVHKSGSADELREIEVVADGQRWYLGAIYGQPHLYSFTLSQETSIAISLRTPVGQDLEAMRPELLLVKDVPEKGIEEIMRLEYLDTQWKELKDAKSGLSYYSSEVINLNLVEGVYRIEVSMANAEGKYMLVVGEDISRESFSTNWNTIEVLYDFYGLSSFAKLRSPVVYYPIGIVILLGLIGVTWFFRSRLRL